MAGEGSGVAARRSIVVGEAKQRVRDGKDWTQMHGYAQQRAVELEQQRLDEVRRMRVQEQNGAAKRRRIARIGEKYVKVQK